MGRFALIGLLLAGTALAPGAVGEGDGSAVSGYRGAAASAGSGPAASGELLVLAVIGTERSASAVHGERAVVADPRTGEQNSFALPGGTLCHGPLMAVGDRVIYSGYRGSKAFAMSLPLTLRASATSLGRADAITPSARPGRLWLGLLAHDGKRSRVDVPGGGDSGRGGHLPGGRGGHGSGGRRAPRRPASPREPPPRRAPRRFVIERRRPARPLGW